MEIARLIKMANDIGMFFEVDKDRERGVAGVADHIRKFWEPRMRRQLLAYFEEKSGEGLSPIVIEALRSHSSDLKPLSN